jgi:hypothetical protein
MAEPKPSLGRIVLVSDRESNGTTEHPAIINRVWSDVCVNLTVLPDCGEPYCKTSVELNTTGAEVIGQWRWPPRV